MESWLRVRISVALFGQKLQKTLPAFQQFVGFNIKRGKCKQNDQNDLLMALWRASERPLILIVRPQCLIFVHPYRGSHALLILAVELKESTKIHTNFHEGSQMEIICTLTTFCFVFFFFSMLNGVQEYSAVLTQNESRETEINGGTRNFAWKDHVKKRKILGCHIIKKLNFFPKYKTVSEIFQRNSVCLRFSRGLAPSISDSTSVEGTPTRSRWIRNEKSNIIP